MSLKLNTEIAVVGIDIGKNGKPQSEHKISGSPPKAEVGSRGPNRRSGPGSAIAAVPWREHVRYQFHFLRAS